MRFHRMALVLSLCAACTPLAASAQPSPPPRADRRGPPPPPPGQSYANSSAVLVADIAFARLAREKGQWTAFRETAAPDAITVMAGPVLAQQWLKDRADPPVAARWQATSLFMACDGRTGASTGPLTFPDGTIGHYASVWQNLEKPRAKKPKWKWAFNYGVTAPMPAQDDDMITSRTATCTGNPKAALGDIPLGPLPKDAPLVAPGANGARASADGTMVWRWSATANGGQTVTIELWNGTSFDTVVRDEIPANAA